MLAVVSLNAPLINKPTCATYAFSIVEASTILPKHLSETLVRLLVELKITKNFLDTVATILESRLFRQSKA